jgi:hypothetical protein
MVSSRFAVALESGRDSHVTSTRRATRITRFTRRIVLIRHARALRTHARAAAFVRA